MTPCEEGFMFSAFALVLLSEVFFSFFLGVCQEHRSVWRRLELDGS